jgi:hypothetical protein
LCKPISLLLITVYLVLSSHLSKLHLDSTNRYRLSDLG